MLHWPHWQRGEGCTLSCGPLWWTLLNIGLSQNGDLHSCKTIWGVFLSMWWDKEISASYPLVVDLEVIELCECPGVPHRSVQCSPALTCPFGTQHWSCRGFCSKFPGKCCPSYCAHTLRKSSCFTGRAWGGAGFARILRRSNIFYLQQVKLGFFLVSNFLLQILLFQWFLPCSVRILKAGKKPLEVLCEGAALQPVWAWVPCSFHGAFLSCPWATQSSELQIQTPCFNPWRT